LGVSCLVCWLAPGAAQEDLWRRDLDAGRKAYEQGHYAEAEKLLLLSLKEAEQFGATDIRFADTLGNLASVHRALGKYAESERLDRQALEIRKKVLGPGHPDVATSLNNLAECYFLQGKDWEAKPLIERSLAIREKTLDADDPALAESLQYKAFFSDVASRAPLFLRSLAIREKALKAGHPAAAQGLKYVVLPIVLTVAVAAGTADESRFVNPDGSPTAAGVAAVRSLFRRVLTIQEQTLGPDHPELASNLLGLAEAPLFDAAEREQLFLRGLAIMEKAFGMEHPFVVKSLESLADFYKNQEPPNYKEVSARQRILAIREKTLGPNHPDLIHS
jgi:tetratricopeptide (TPR) repeat protein